MSAFKVRAFIGIPTLVLGPDEYEQHFLSQASPDLPQYTDGSYIGFFTPMGLLVCRPIRG